VISGKNTKDSRRKGIWKLLSFLNTPLYSSLQPLNKRNDFHTVSLITQDKSFWSSWGLFFKSQFCYYYSTRFSEGLWKRSYDKLFPND